VQSAVRLSPGDVLILYTDGITEARNDAGDMLDAEGLIAMARELPIIEPAEMAAQLLARMNKFRGTAPADDDQTFCILQQTGVAENSAA
jgi:phosphoserine phosphatase RsbU/P